MKLPRGSVHVVEDASEHDVYRDNPAVVALGLKHVAATALVTPDDLCIGAPLQQPQRAARGPERRSTPRRHAADTARGVAPPAQAR